MKRTIKVGASFSGVIASGSYENSRPGFTAEEEFEISAEESVINDVATSALESRSEELHLICYNAFKAFEQKAIVERIQKERSDIRFYDGPDGKYPSVTSIINYDSDFGIPPHQLQQYASQSNITHARVAHFIKTGVWDNDYKSLSEIWSDIVIVTKGDLNLSTDSGDFKAFLEDYPINDMKNGEPSFNTVHRYAGTPDFTGIPDTSKGKWKKLEGVKPVKTVFDVKRTVDKEKALMQMSAYRNCEGLTDCKQVIAVPLNDKTQQGFSTPLVSDKVDFYFTMFLNKKKAFSARYGL